MIENVEESSGASACDREGGGIIRGASVCDWECGGIIRGICVWLGVWRNHQGASACDREGGGIIRERLCVIRRVEELSGSVCV